MQEAKRARGGGAFRAAAADAGGRSPAAVAPPARTAARATSAASTSRGRGTRRTPASSPARPRSALGGRVGSGEMQDDEQRRRERVERLIAGFRDRVNAFVEDLETASQGTEADRYARVADRAGRLRPSCGAGRGRRRRGSDPRAHPRGPRRGPSAAAGERPLRAGPRARRARVGRGVRRAGVRPRDAGAGAGDRGARPSVTRSAPVPATVLPARGLRRGGRGPAAGRLDFSVRVVEDCHKPHTLLSARRRRGLHHAQGEWGEADGADDASDLFRNGDACSR